MKPLWCLPLLAVLWAGSVDPMQPSMTALVITPDGQGYLSGSQAGLMHRTFAGDKRSLATKLEHVLSLRFSPDGKTLAAAGGTPGEAGIVELRSWPEGKLVHQLPCAEDTIADIAWLDDRTIAIAQRDSVVTIWDRQTSRKLASLQGHSGPVQCLAVSPDGRLLCSGGADNAIRVWDVTTKQLVRTLDQHLGPVHGLAFRPVGSGPAALASASADGTLRIWQPSIGRLVRIIRHPAPVLGVAWAGDGQSLFTCSKDGTLRQIAGDSDRVLRQRKLADAWMTCIAVAKDRMAVGSADGQAITLRFSDL